MEVYDRAYFPGDSRLTAEFKGRFDTMGEEVSFDVEVLCVFDEWCNFRRREMRDREFFSNAEGGDERAAMS